MEKKHSGCQDAVEKKHSQAMDGDSSLPPHREQQLHSEVTTLKRKLRKAGSLVDFQAGKAAKLGGALKA